MNAEEPQRCLYYTSVDLVSYIQVVTECDIFDLPVWLNIIKVFSSPRSLRLILLTYFLNVYNVAEFRTAGSRPFQSLTVDGKRVVNCSSKRDWFCEIFVVT